VDVQNFISGTVEHFSPAKDDTVFKGHEVTVIKVTKNELISRPTVPSTNQLNGTVILGKLRVSFQVLKYGNCVFSFEHKRKAVWSLKKFV
jgi:hypothetical protein